MIAPRAAARICARDLVGRAAGIDHRDARRLRRRAREVRGAHALEELRALALEAIRDVWRRRLRCAPRALQAPATGASSNSVRSGRRAPCTSVSNCADLLARQAAAAP